MDKNVHYKNIFHYSKIKLKNEKINKNALNKLITLILIKY